MNSPNPTGNAPAQPVGPATASVGTLIAGVLGYLTTWVAAKYSLPAELVSGVMSLLSAGAMAILHQTKK